jgi:hypothetical protein
VLFFGIENRSKQKLDKTTCVEAMNEESFESEQVIHYYKEDLTSDMNTEEPEDSTQSQEISRLREISRKKLEVVSN